MVYFSEIQGNWLILLGVIFNVFSMASYNAVGVAIAKYINSVARALCDVSRIVIVWGVGIIITLALGDNDPRFKWESLNGWLIVGLTAGFVIIIFGNLIYY